jgi:hypothetical protein
MAKRRLVVDGADNCESRGLMILSALSLIADDLTDVDVRILNGEEPSVRIAAECLGWDTNLNISVVPPSVEPTRELSGASLYVAIVSSTITGAHAELAAALGVPSIVAVQYPSEDVDARTLTLLRAAHDPGVLGRVILEALGRAG